MNEIIYWSGSVKKEKILRESSRKSNIYGGGHNEVIKNTMIQY